LDLLSAHSLRLRNGRHHSLSIYQRGGEHSARTWIDDLRQATLDIRIQLDKNLGARGLNVEIPGVTPKAFSSEVDTGSREEHSSKQKIQSEPIRL
jgi:hypothetical protein